MPMAETFGLKARNAGEQGFESSSRRPGKKQANPQQEFI
jgi:hypothetical protein